MTTWNSADKAAALTLSGGDLIVTNSTGAASNYQNVRSTTSKTSGKFVVKLTYGSIVDQTQVGFGLANSSAPLGNNPQNFLGVDANATAVYGGTDIDTNNAVVANIANPTGPYFAFDIDNATLRTSADGATWNGPASFPMPAGAKFLAVGLYNPGETATLDPAPTGWTLSGFSNWDAGGGGPTAYSLTAAVGAFALSGVASAQKISRASSAGAFALAGQTTNQKISMTSGAGAFALAGQNAAQKISMTSGPGALALSGQAANLTYTPFAPGATHYTLTAATGAFTVSGQDASQKLSFKSDVGAFTFAGNAATLSYAPYAPTDYTLTAGTGAFVLTGYDANVAPAAADGDGAESVSTGRNPRLFHLGGMVGLDIPVHKIEEQVRAAQKAVRQAVKATVKKKDSEQAQDALGKAADAILAVQEFVPQIDWDRLWRAYLQAQQAQDHDARVRAYALAEMQAQAMVKAIADHAERERRRAEDEDEEEAVIALLFAA